MPVLSVICRVLIGINFVRFALSFFPRFEGTAGSIGWIDTVFGDYRVGGFRIDFLWVVVSTMFLVFAGFRFLRQGRIARRAYVDAGLCFGWAVAFWAFLYHLARLGAIDFG